jgi:hypothetical protein
MGRLPYKPALYLIRNVLAALWPVAALAFATVLLPGTISYARGSNALDETRPAAPAEQPSWSSHAAATVTAAMVGSRHVERSSLQMGSAGFFYAAD